MPSISVLYFGGSGKMLFLGETLGLIPNIGFVLSVINFDARRKVPSPPIGITKSDQRTHFVASDILHNETETFVLKFLTLS